MKNPETVEISNVTTLDTGTKSAADLAKQQQADVSAMRLSLIHI